jgi:hypothetical protein
MLRESIYGNTGDTRQRPQEGQRYSRAGAGDYMQSAEDKRSMTSPRTPATKARKRKKNFFESALFRYGFPSLTTGIATAGILSIIFS